MHISNKLIARIYITNIIYNYIIHNIILGHLSTDISFLVWISVTCWIICTVNNWNAQEWTEKVDLHIIHSILVVVEVAINIYISYNANGRYSQWPCLKNSLKRWWWWRKETNSIFDQGYHFFQGWDGELHQISILRYHIHDFHQQTTTFSQTTRCRFWK